MTDGSEERSAMWDEIRTIWKQLGLTDQSSTVRERLEQRREDDTKDGT